MGISLPGGSLISNESNTDLNGYMDSMSIDQQSLEIVVESTSVYLDVEKNGGGDISYWINGVKYILDCTSGDGVDGRARVELPQGTAIEDKWSCCYVAWSEQDNDFKLLNSEVLPIGAFAPVAYTSIQDYSTVDSTGPIVFQRTTEAITHSEQGAISRMRENTRLVRGGGWWEGIDPTLTITTNAGSMDNISLDLTSGVAYQMNRQSFPVYDVSSDGIWLVGLDGTGSLDNLQRITDLSALSETSTGDSLSDGDMIIWDVYANINYSGEDCKVFIIPSNIVYTDTDKVKQAARGSRNHIMPRNSKSVGMFICRLVMKYNTANSGTWSNVLTDPQLVWKSGSQTITTPNYPSNYNNNYDDYIGTITEGSATKIRVNFYNFNTESNYDYIKIRNNVGTTFYTYHGNLGSFTSGIVSGTVLKVHFKSDGSVTRSGCRILTYDYQVTVATGSEFIDLRL